MTICCNLCTDTQYCPQCLAEERKLLEEIFVEDDTSEKEKPHFRHPKKGLILSEKDIISITEYENTIVKVRTLGGLFCCRKTRKGLKVIRVLRTKPEHRRKEKESPVSEELQPEGEELPSPEVPTQDWKAVLMEITQQGEETPDKLRVIAIDKFLAMLSKAS